MASNFSDFDNDQSSMLKYSQSVAETSTFSNTVGASVSVGTSFKCGIPALAESSVDVSGKHFYIKLETASE